MAEENFQVLDLPVYGPVKIGKTLGSHELKRKLEFVDNVSELGVSPPKKLAIEQIFNVRYSEDIFSGVSDPNIVLQNDNACIIKPSSSNDTDDLSDFSGDKVIAGAITSESSANSCTLSCNDGVCTSQVAREISKYGSTTGVRKITFKIHRKSEECNSNLSTSGACVFSNELHADDAVKQGALPMKRVRKSLHQNSTSLVTGLKKKTSKGRGKKRSDDLHKLLFLPNGLEDGAYLAYCMKGEKVLEGYKQGNGIVCSHCSNKISPSQFEAHAGCAARKKPYQHIYAANGFTLHDIAISLADRQIQTTWNNSDERNADDMDSSSMSNSNIIRLTRTTKKSDTDYGASCVLCTGHDFSVNKFDDRTVIICDQCEKEFHVGCLREGGHCDLKEIPKDKWFCCHDCDRIYASLKGLVSGGSEVIPSSETSKLNKNFDVADNDVQWRLLSGKCCLPDNLPLLAKATYLFRVSFSPINAQSGHDLIPLMVHGRHVSGQDFGGMYCLLLTINTVVVSAGLLRIFGHEIAELPLVATKMKFRGKGYFLALFSRIEKLLSSLKVKNLVLPAAEQAKPMWVNRLGFREVCQEKLSVYTRMFQLTQFSGTVMLEKELEQLLD